MPEGVEEVTLSRWNGLAGSLGPSAPRCAQQAAAEKAVSGRPGPGLALRVAYCLCPFLARVFQSLLSEGPGEKSSEHSWDMRSR